MKNYFFSFSLLVSAFFLVGNVNAQQNIWTDINESSIKQKGAKQIVPAKYRTLSLNITALQDVLAYAPWGKNTKAQNSDTILVFPLPNGSFGRFSIVESSVMAPELAAKFPELKTYSGQGLDDATASVRFDFTSAGFHAMILSSQGQIFIDPYSKGDINHYISYYKKDFAANNKRKMICDLGPIDTGSLKKKLSLPRSLVAAKASGSELRTYRIAIAATGEYTAFHGGTVALGLSAIITTLNRITGIYETEVAVSFTLVGTNDQIVYTDSATDPYTNNNGFLMLSENQTNIDAVIGVANYDVGHVVSTGGGGIASLGVPCIDSFKAQGVTGLSSPVGDPFDVDYVAHEVGHQFGANHTFNSDSGSCAGGNRNASTAVEPGSGTTVMAYAGICSPHNIQNNSDAYFSTISHDEIVTYTTTGSGNNCPTTTATGNDVPVVDAGIGGHTIPISTPFTLTGSATDAHSLTYSWEQVDVGPAGDPNAPSGDAPIFRFFTPASTGSRIFPQISDITSGTQTMGEILPSYARTLNFRLTAKDNQTGGGGVNYASLAVPVEATAGPFLVTSPNTAVSWTANASQTVTWDVANTSAAPVSCASVNILLSTDGGATFPTTILSNTSNDGTEAITVPNFNTATARLKVEAADNIFFDISDADFTISGATATVALTVTTAGAGSGSVTANTGTLIWTGNSGTASYSTNTSVILTATAGTGSTFSGWSGGGCTGTGTCTVTMSSIQSVTATFSSTIIYTLTVTKDGVGADVSTVTPNTGTLTWSGNTGTATYEPGTSVVLTATAGAGYSLNVWSGGGCSGKGTCTVTMDADKSVTANFLVFVPTLSQWGQVVLAILLLAGCFFVVFNRRKVYRS